MRNHKRKTPSLEKRLLAYSVAAGSTLAVASAVDAAIIHYEGPWTGTGRDNYLVSFNLAGEVLVNNRHVPNEQFSFSNSFDETMKGADTYDMLRLHGRGAAAAYAIASTYKGNTGQVFAKPLPAGVTIGPDVNQWGNNIWLMGTKSGSNYYNYWQNGKRAYIGLRFDGPGNDLYYGWADITAVNKQTLTLWSYAYEDTGASIRTGQLPPQPEVIPEPATISLLALGAAGLAALRRRQQKAKTHDTEGQQTT